MVFKLKIYNIYIYYVTVNDKLNNIVLFYEGNRILIDVLDNLIQHISSLYAQMSFHLFHLLLSESNSTFFAI